MKSRLSRRAVLAGAVSTLTVAATVRAPAQGIQERTIRWGHLNNPGHPTSLGVRKVAEVLLAKSGGKLRIREFPASQLGNEMQQQSALRGGTQEMFSASTTSLATVVKDFGLLDFPFIVGSSAQAEALITGPFGKAMLETLPEKDLIGLGYWGLGFRNVTNSRTAITKLEEFAGLKLRVIPNPVYLDTFRALGANPVPMNFGEVYTALETKTIDGQENPYSVILSNKFFEVQKFLSATNHTYTQNIITIGKKFWDQLSADERKLIQDSVNESRDYQREVTLKADTESLGELKAKGMQFNEIAPAEMARIRTATRPVAAKFSADLDQAKVRLFNAELERVQKL
ncbi:TRAP transporter substrate-binding protein [Phreatobacter aquaticus]|uniref:TRAP transporter substrate-binding protein n=1 Tax=Phreatobacter aquaticus TaxID=2570229 RepID=A0A4D7QLB5_9HYPH|nr:TRAP transporter substrate-binding protein [Phreatobacter aquaticus]QCK87915.1 TRAP transporter substrate-binding protein [Phreatobacter aquaticus]